MLSFSSIGTRAGLIFFSAFAPLNFSRDQNLIAVSPSGNPSVVTARLECIRMPQAVYCRGRPCASAPATPMRVLPTAVMSSRL